MAVARMESKARMALERPPAVLISSWVRRGKEVVQMAMTSIMPMNKLPVVMRPIERVMLSVSAATAMRSGAETVMQKMIPGFGLVNVAMKPPAIWPKTNPTTTRPESVALCESESPM
jgi:hypothetical protein